MSDVHAYETARLKETENRPSYMEISSAENAAENPFTALSELIARESLSVDLLISGGDMGDKATPAAIQYTWGRIKQVQQSLKAPNLLAATGNHDMDSRHRNGHDPRGMLQNLPNYPFDDAALNNEYWANNVVVQESAGVRSVLLNSSAYHGNDEEWRHGRASARTREYLKRRLDATSDPGINLLVTHHQLYQIGNYDLGDKSHMAEAPALLDLLGCGDYGHWLLVHGHRHWPNISYASGGRGSPVVFSAGSFSAVLWDEIQNSARNQFYILEIEDTAPGNPIRGKYTAWDWVPARGFEPAQEGSGLSHRGGFGGYSTGAQLAQKVREIFDREAQPFLSWTVLESEIDDLAYTLPSDFKAFIKNLKQVHDLDVLSIQGQPAQVGRTSA
ncbi:hypothetical protein M3667_03295 [Microbacterium sp. P26]|uniref:metallophosphoesterase family protein n=1 Tax=Microbacterium TaxID=33882 RepID=UPI00203C057C|nr:metallophosphoesterase [Microbacterium sp. P26]MCM3500903.1 hypothetical protein [Microbacterium sp. P26]